MRAVRLSNHLLFMSLLGGTLLGCAGAQFHYAPTENTEHTPKQVPGATYPYPPDSKESYIRVDSYGFERVEVPGRGKVHALWMHLLISNRDRADWKINLNDCRIRFEGTTGIAPLIVKADSDLLPWLNIRTSESRIASIFFELPEGKQSLADLSKFEFYWKLDVTTVALNYWTPFEKARLLKRKQNFTGAPFLPGTQMMGPMIPGMR